jgi:hypothetical protein
MLNKAKTLKGYKLKSLDGEIGEISEFYFDDRHWAVRYLVADTGNWLTGRQVLISPYALAALNIADGTLSVHLTKQQIEGSPSLESHTPVSRQFEEKYYGYYGWPMYWYGPYMWGWEPGITPDSSKWRQAASTGKGWDPHLRSTHDVTGHHIQALDGEVGHVEDFIIDDDTWAIRYLVINTRNWWVGKKVLISPKWIERVSWAESKVFINLHRETIKQAPEYVESSLTRDYEKGLHQHYNLQGYWLDDPASPKHLR